MQKIVVDTNVLVSAIIQKNLPYHLMYWLLRSVRITVCTSPEILLEYEEVLSRPKFNRIAHFRNEADTILTLLNEAAISFRPAVSLQLLSDPDDNKFLELALEAEADFLITGNTQDFTLTDFAGCRIVSPRQYWDEYRPDLL